MRKRKFILYLEDIKLGHTEPLWLRPLSFKVAQGDWVLIYGPNGGGKSTLLRGMMGTVPLYLGRVLRHYDVDEMGYLPQVQKWNELMPLTVGEFVGQGYRRPGTLEEKKRALKNALNLCQVRRMERRQVSELSGGELQRVAVARAIVANPRILFVDELGTYLDPDREMELFELLVNYQKSHPTCTVLMATHSLQYLRKIPKARVLWANQYDQELEEIAAERIEGRFADVLE